MKVGSRIGWCSFRSDIHHVCVALAVLFMVGGPQLLAAEGGLASWNQFHGPNGTGIAAGDAAASKEESGDGPSETRARRAAGVSLPVRSNAIAAPAEGRSDAPAG